MDPKTDDELVRPARDGTLRVLKASRETRPRSRRSSSAGACRRSLSLRRIGLTRRTAATHPPYDRAKTIAKRAAWAWHKAEGGALELVSVNPSLVLGPVLGSDFSASVEAVSKLLDGSIPALPHFGFSLVDVRDIAALQLLAMTTPSATRQRFIVSCEFCWMADIAKILKQGLGDKARKVPSIPLPDFVVRVIAIFEPVARGRVYELGKRRQVSSEKARRMLGWTTRPGETIVQTPQKPSGAGLGVD